MGLSFCIHTTQINHDNNRTHQSCNALRETMWTDSFSAQEIMNNELFARRSTDCCYPIIIKGQIYYVNARYYENFKSSCYKNEKDCFSACCDLKQAHKGNSRLRLYPVKISFYKGLNGQTLARKMTSIDPWKKVGSQVYNESMGFAKQGAQCFTDYTSDKVEHLKDYGTQKTQHALNYTGGVCQNIASKAASRVGTIIHDNVVEPNMRTATRYTREQLESFDRSSSLIARNASIFCGVFAGTCLGSYLLYKYISSLDFSRNKRTGNTK
jgi:hypothetical protein